MFKKIIRHRDCCKAKIDKRHRHIKHAPEPMQTERGIASFYVAIFATLIFGIITLSFVRIMLSEARQTTNNDLSRSAYDAALAGIEDGKIAVLKYNECISQGVGHATDTSDWYSGDVTNECERIVHNMEKGIADSSCDTVAKTLLRSASNGDNTGEVLVQESGNAAQGLEQAYTCVKVSEKLRDYLSTLNSTNRTRVIPLRTEDNATFNAIRFKWYSRANHDNQSKSSNDNRIDKYSYNDNQTKFGSEPLAPPPMAVSLIQTDQSFTLNQLSVSSSDGTDVGRLTLVPSTDGADDISASVVKNSADKSTNNITKVKCQSEASMDAGSGDDYACSVTINLPKTFENKESRNISSTFMVVSLLYGDPITDISVELCNSSCTSSSSGGGGITSFSGVQTAIDSTGRANDLYRRIETRLELYDVEFPYPEYAIQTDGNGSITKNFYITKNCWYSNSPSLDGTSSDTGNTCKNNNAAF